MLVKLVKELESMPEGDGSMMDHSLIVYTAIMHKQHASGANWPFILIGNPNGPIKTGQFTQMEKRPINDLYNTLLHAAGINSDRFNMDKNFAENYHSKAAQSKTYYLSDFITIHKKQSLQAYCYLPYRYYSIAD